jgi:hypothetical protein
MWESIQEWFNSTDWSFFQDNLNNDTLIGYITSPVGLGISVVLIIISFFLKWRLVFVGISTVLAGLLVARYTMTDTGGPNKSILLFAGGAVLVSALAIYFSLMSEE